MQKMAMDGRCCITLRKIVLLKKYLFLQNILSILTIEITQTVRQYLLQLKKNYTEVVKFLIKHKASLNIINKYGDSPLHIAVSKKKYYITKILLSAGANPNLKNRAGETAVDVAKRLKDKVSIEVIKRYGDD